MCILVIAQLRNSSALRSVYPAGLLRVLSAEHSVTLEGSGGCSTGDWFRSCFADFTDSKHWSWEYQSCLVWHCPLFPPTVSTSFTVSCVVWSFLRQGSLFVKFAAWSCIILCTMEQLKKKRFIHSAEKNTSHLGVFSNLCIFVSVNFLFWSENSKMKNGAFFDFLFRKRKLENKKRGLF